MVGRQRGTTTVNGATLAEAWDGTSWSVEATSGHGSLNSVSCIPGGPCVTAGWDTNAGGFNQTLIETTG
jgi:hypothetical protein